MAQTADQTKPRIRSTATTETQRDLAETRGFAHGGPDQRDEPADQRLEQLFPHRGGEGDVRGTGLVYVLPCTAVYETAPSDEVRLVENGEYWGRSDGHQDRWVFMDKERHATLRKFAWTKIVRHRLVPKNYFPDDPTLQDYWRQRRLRTTATDSRYRQVFQRQRGLCPVCLQPVENGEATHLHHVLPKKRGGMDDLVNCG